MAQRAKTAVVGHFRLVTHWPVLVQFVIEISVGLKRASLLLLNQIGFQEPTSA